MSTFRVFLCDYERDRTIAAEEAIWRTLEETIDEFDRLSDCEGDFIGMYMPDGTVVQFMYNEVGTLDIDVPQPGRRGSLRRTTTFEECRRIIIEKLGQSLSATAIPDLTFESWDGT